MKTTRYLQVDCSKWTGCNHIYYSLFYINGRRVKESVYRNSIYFAGHKPCVDSKIVHKHKAPCSKVYYYATFED